MSRRSVSGRADSRPAPGWRRRPGFSFGRASACWDRGSSSANSRSNASGVIPVRGRSVSGIRFKRLVWLTHKTYGPGPLLCSDSILRNDPDAWMVVDSHEIRFEPGLGFEELVQAWPNLV